MSPLAAKPVLHGRDHCAGGADPIPCLLTGGAAGDFETVVMATTDLYAYWRLGETGSPWADTSGVATADGLTLNGSGTALTPDVAGALEQGDDGAVEFNYDGTSGTGGRYLETQNLKDFRGFVDGTTGHMTVAAWVKVKAGAATRRGHIIGNSNVLGDNSMSGWGLHVMYPSRAIRFTRGQHAPLGPELYVETPGGVVADDWNLFVGTYDGATIRLYANGNLVGSTADATPLAGNDHYLRVGYSITQYAAGYQHSWLYGTVDEAAIWTRALTASEIETLYAAGVDATPASGSRVLVSDGAGGSHWGQANGDAIEDAAIVDRHVAADADIQPTKIQHPGGTTTFLRADGTWATPAGGGGAPSADTQVWMPLTTVVSSVPELVWDASNSLIPTLTPI